MPSPPPPPTPTRSPADSAARRTALAVAAATVLLLVVVAGAALSGDWSVSLEPAPSATGEVLPPTAAPTEPTVFIEPRAEEPDEWAGRAATVVLALVGALLVAFLLYRLGLWVRRTLVPWLATGRDRPVDPGPPQAVDPEVVPLTALHQGATLAQTLLREGEHSSDAIIAAWLALEDAAMRSGARRAPAQTPTEFTVAVLGATPASPAAVSELLGLYHLARFAHTEMTGAQVAAAGAALRRLTEDFSR